MAERAVLNPEAIKKIEESTKSEVVSTIPTGATLLDLALNGGWALGRACNIVGDSSSGKSLCVIEAMANFAQRFSVKDIRYNEPENALNKDYAESIGLPRGVAFVGDDAVLEVNRRGSRTIEEFDADFCAFLKPRIGKDRPCLYALDSFDALSDASEMKIDLGDSKAFGKKAILSSEFYRRHIADISASQCLLLMVSQVRDNVGVMFGETKTRSGGRSHDFYATQIVWLATGKQIKGRGAGVERTIGVHTIFNVKKNKIGKPFGRAPIIILYNYGIDDEMSNLAWLLSEKMGSAKGQLSLPVAEYAEALQEARAARDMNTIKQMRSELQKAVRIRWQEIDDALAPTMKKYE